MAPLRSIIRHELLYEKSNSSIRFWYGARGKQELFYVDELDELQTQHENFNWHPVLSDPSEDDDWQGLTGFVHVSVRENVLDAIDNCSEFEYYICGPPPMLAATRTLLAEYGVPETRVFFDDFGI